MSTASDVIDQIGRSPLLSLRPHQFLDLLPVAAYVCDRGGRIVHYNTSAAELWGRAPGPGQRFCGSLRLYRADGAPLVHAECPTAEALRNGRSLRDCAVVIERPDRSRVVARAHIAVLTDDAEDIIGALSFLHVLSDPAQARGSDNVALLAFERQVREQAKRLRRDKQPQAGGTAQSVRYFQELLLRLPAAVYATDAAGRITFYNEAAADLWGIRPELGRSEFCGSWKIYLPDGTRLPHDECPMAKALKEGRPNPGMEAVAERPDGSRVPFMAYPTPMFDDSGNLIGAVNMLVDLTELKRGEEAASRLAAIVESSHDAIISKDLFGTIRSWNRAAQRLFGYTAEEAVGQSITILYPPDRLDEEAAIIERVRRGQRVESYDTVRRRKDGSLVDVSLTVSPLRDSAGRVVGASAIVRDITAKKRSDAQRDLLLKEMNHRVKNLLTLCNGIVSLSKRSARSVDEMANAVEGRLRALASAHDLTLPALSQPDEEADRTTTLRNILTTIVAPHIASSAAKARVISDGPDVPVSGKAAANLALLLHELTTNAAKYGALSSDSGHIEVRWKLRSSRLLLTWKERGGPVLDGPPAKGGFGTLLARQIVTAPLGGDIAYDWQRDGLGVAIAISADRLTPVLTPPRRAKSPRT